MTMFMGIVLMGLSLFVVVTQIEAFGSTTEDLGFEGSTSEYQMLKLSCSQWGLYIDQCPNCDCDSCKGAFFKTMMPQAYNVPVLLFTSGLVTQGSGGSLESERLSSNSDFCAACSASGSTFKCAEAAKFLVGSENPLEADSAVIRQNIENPQVRNILVGENEEGEQVNYVSHCADVCSAIRDKAEKCESGIDECIADPTKLP